MRNARLAALLATVLAGGVLTPRAHAWEPDVNAGITERAGRASKLHALLARVHGRALGLYEPLAASATDAPALAKRLGRLDPTLGAVPDGRGRQPALAWLIAGALLEESPGTRSRHHFLDPIRKTGLTRRTVGTVRNLRARVSALLAGGGVPTSGKRADAWIVAPENELGLARFWTELEAATIAGPADQRERHLAYALVCAGAIVAVLEDLASPSRVRDDLAAHLMPLGAGADDLGSRTERLASLAFGRLGTPVPVAAPARRTWRDFFTATDGKGLADVVAARTFSQGTLPPAVPSAAPLSERRAAFVGLIPTVRAEDAQRAPTADVGLPVRDADGVCLAHLRERAAMIEWLLPDACVVNQLATLLPLAGGYAAGLLDWLFRGTLDVTAGGEVKAGLALGPGRLTLLVDDAKGLRHRLGDVRDVAAGSQVGAVLARAPQVPAGSVTLIALFKGQDANGDELVAVGQLGLVRPRAEDEARDAVLPLPTEPVMPEPKPAPATQPAPAKKPAPATQPASP